MKKLFDLTGKTAIVTGGRNGLLGPIWVEALKEAGAGVMVFDLPEDDVTQFSGTINEIYQFREPHGVDILINSAATDNPPGSNASFFGNFDEIMAVNINGAVNMCRAVIPGMIERGGGVIVNIGSIMGNVGADWRNYPSGWEKPIGYNCSKAALVQLSRSICTQYGQNNIRSVTISFGPYAGGKLSSDFLAKFLRNVPLGRTISRESLKTTLLYACCCPELSGTQLLVDGGYTAW